MIFLKYFLLSLIISAFSFSQEESGTSPGVELPDFVITGKDIIRIKKSDKLTPFLITTFSEKFVLPEYSSEEIPVRDISFPKFDDLKNLKALMFNNGYVLGSLGFYCFPNVDALYASPIKDGILRAKFSGYYRRPYIENSDKYKLSAGADLIFWNNINSPFLPGAQLKLKSDLSTDGFKFFGSKNPTEKRTINKFLADFNLHSEYYSNFNFKIAANNNFTSLSNEKFNENLLALNLNSLIKISPANIGLTTIYKNISLTNDTSNHSEKNYLFFRPTAGFHFTELVKGSFGFTYSKTSSNKFIMPYAELAVKLLSNLIFLSEFNPTSEYISPANLLEQNPFLMVNKMKAIVTNKNMQYIIAVKYEYQNHYQIDGGFEFFSSDSIPYFSINEQNKYSINFSDIKSITPFINFNFYPGRFGHLFSELKLNASINNNGQTIPFKPAIKFIANYSYPFSEIITTSIYFTFFGKSYSDLENTKQNDSYTNLALSLSYKFNKKFDFSIMFDNLLNKKNYFWTNYLEKPFDINLIIKYKI